MVQGSAQRRYVGSLCLGHSLWRPYLPEKFRDIDRSGDVYASEPMAAADTWPRLVTDIHIVKALIFVGMFLVEDTMDAPFKDAILEVMF